MKFKENEKVKAYAVVEQMTDPVPVKNMDSHTNSKGIQFITFDAILQEFNKWNRNERWYGEGYKDTFRTPRMIELIRTNGLCGEANHPMAPSIDRVKHIEFSNISHIIKNLEIQGDVMSGKVETVDYGMGNLMRSMILQGLDPSFSSRALVHFTLDGQGRKITNQPGYYVACDWVFYPSFHNAYIKPGEKATLVNFDPSTKQKTEFALESATSSNEFDLFELGASDPFVASATDFISLESTALKDFNNQFDLNREVRLSKDLKEVYVTENGLESGQRTTFCIPVERHIQNEIKHGMKKLGW